MAAKVTEINCDTFMLTDRLIRVNQFVLSGSEKSLLIDTGYGGEKFLRPFNLAFPDPSLVSGVFRGIGNDQSLIHICCHKRVFFIINRVVGLFIRFIQCAKVNKLFGSYLAELRGIHCDPPFILFHFFQRMCDHIGSVSETVEAAVIQRTQPAIRTENKFAAVEIPDDLLL